MKFGFSHSNVDIVLDVLACISICVSNRGVSFTGYDVRNLGFPLIRVYGQFCIETIHRRHNGIERLVVCLSEYLPLSCVYRT